MAGVRFERKLLCEFRRFLAKPALYYRMIRAGLRRLLFVKQAPTGIFTTIGRLGNASRETKSALLFAMPDK